MSPERDQSAIANPQWIARMYEPKAGRDHLGLQSVSQDQILGDLSPGVNVLTVHPRYHSFYTFLLDEFWRRDRPRNRASWVAFYRPREFIFSVGAHVCDHAEHRDLGNIVGSIKTRPVSRQRQSFDTTTNYIDSDLGGYGLYYDSVIADLGLIYPGGPRLPYPIDVPTERGKEVAAAFRAAIRGTTYFRDFFDHDATHVPLDVVREYIRRACLCQLQTKQAPDRMALRDAFLHGGTESEAVARRATFRMLLDIAAQTEGVPLDQDAFRQLIYFRACPSGGRYAPLDAVRDTFRRWRLYQAREYYAFALYALWNHLCEWGLANHGDTRPLALSALWEHLDAALDFRSLAHRLRVEDPAFGAEATFQDLLAWLQGVIGASGAAFDEAGTLDAPVHEHRLYQQARDHRDDPAAMVAGMVTMLGVIQLRFGHPERWFRAEWDVSRKGAEGRLSVDEFVRAMHDRLRRGPVTIRAIVRWLVSDYVILQHQLVAGAKLPESTFRFQREGERLRFFILANTLTFADSRFHALSTTVHELGFCGDLGSDRHRLTDDGRRLLLEGDL